MKYVVVFDSDCDSYCICFDDSKDAFDHIKKEFNKEYDIWITDDLKIYSNINGKITDDYYYNYLYEDEEFDEQLWFTIHDEAVNGVYQTGSTWYLYSAIEVK